MAIINNNPVLLLVDPSVDPTPLNASFCYRYKPGFNSVAIAFTFTKVDNDDLRESVKFTTAIRLSGARGGGIKFRESIPGPTDVMDRRSYVEERSGSYFFSIPQTQPGETVINVELTNPASQITLEVMQNPGHDYFSSLYSIAGSTKVHELNNGNIVNEFLKNGTSTNMAVNGSVVPVTFTYSVPRGRRFKMSELSLIVSTTANITGSFNNFADQAVLTNGIQIITDLNPPSFVLKSNADIDGFSEQVDDGGAFGKTGKYFTARFDYAKVTCGNCATIYDTVRAIVNDDISGLVGLAIAVKGYLV